MTRPLLDKVFKKKLIIDSFTLVGNQWNDHYRDYGINLIVNPKSHIFRWELESKGKSAFRKNPCLDMNLMGLNKIIHQIPSSFHFLKNKDLILVTVFSSTKTLGQESLVFDSTNLAQCVPLPMDFFTNPPEGNITINIKMIKRNLKFWISNPRMRQSSMIEDYFDYLQNESLNKNNKSNTFLSNRLRLLGFYFKKNEKLPTDLSKVTKSHRLTDYNSLVFLGLYLNCLRIKNLENEVCFILAKNLYFKRRKKLKRLIKAINFLKKEKLPLSFSVEDYPENVKFIKEKLPRQLRPKNSWFFIGEITEHYSFELSSLSPYIFKYWIKTLNIFYKIKRNIMEAFNGK